MVFFCVKITQSIQKNTFFWGIQTTDLHSHPWKKEKLPPTEKV